MKKKFTKGIILLFWLILWFVLAAVVDNKILLANPPETVKALFRLLKEQEFYRAVHGSLLRIGLGFFTGAAAAVLLAAVSAKFVLVQEVLAPVMNLIKTVPVASFVVLLLIWWGSAFLAVVICFLVVLPNLYISTLEGLKNADGKLLEMAWVFRLPLWNRFFYIYRPALKPFLCSSLKLSLGMCWKSGVAAEVIGTPDFSIGERLYLSKVYLDTADLFAWTMVIIGVSLLFEKLVMRLVRSFFEWEPGCAAQKLQRTKEPLAAEIRLNQISKSYGGQAVLKDVNAVYEPGQVYYLTTPSGSGKTTLLRILAGLEKPDHGEVSGNISCSMMFQEDRLCEEADPVKNVEMITGDREYAGEALRLLLEEDALKKPCNSLSGGMKRRVALVRAMEADSELVLLDEPFTGMDAGTKKRAEEYIRKRQGNRILVIATHI